MADENQQGQARKGFWGRLFGAEQPAVENPENKGQPEGAKEALPDLDAQTSHDEVIDEQNIDVHVPEDILPDDLKRDEITASEPEKGVEENRSWFSRLTSGLSRSSNQLTSGITGLFTKAKLDADTIEDLEDLLIQADLGVETATAITARLSKERFDKTIAPEEVQAALADEVAKVLAPAAQPLVIDTGKKPFVILMVGVNGAGKTTTIGKLSAKFAKDGHKVMLAAGDTFRAAAINQLKVWAERTGAGFIAKEQGADAASLAFDAIEAAKRENVDVLLIDTAGRLQNRAELMAELEKVIRVIKKQIPDAPHATLLVLDATTGQNAVAQTEIFSKQAGITGLIMTKLDGTARGGILVSIARKFGLPVHFIGVGEGVADLQPFAADDFAAAIAGLKTFRKD